MKPSERILEICIEDHDHRSFPVRILGLSMCMDPWVLSILRYLDEQAESREDKRPAVAPSFEEAQEEPGSGFMGVYVTAVENRLRRIEAILRVKAEGP